MPKPILCLDFDGVLHSYTSGWKGAAVIPDPPVEGAKEFLTKALENFDVCVFSSRSHQPGGAEAMIVWCAVNFGSSIADDLSYVFNKPAAMVTLDDRALTFTGVWPSVDTLLAFKPWNKA